MLRLKIIDTARDNYVVFDGEAEVDAETQTVKTPSLAEYIAKYPSDLPKRFRYQFFYESPTGQL